MTNENPHIAGWKTLVDLPVTETWDVDDFTGFFSFFWPDGSGVEAVFEGLERGDLVEARLRRCFTAVAEAPKRGNWYFLPPPDPNLTENEMIERTKAHLDSMSEIAALSGEAEFAQQLRDMKISPVASRERTVNVADAEIQLYEMVSDFSFGLNRFDSPMWDLREAFYSVANENYLREWLMWPLYDDPPLADPFAPYFWLWSSGLDVELVSERECVVGPVG